MNSYQKWQLERFMYLAYIMHVSDKDIVIDERGLTMEMFETIDLLLGDYLAQYDLDAMREELIQLVKELSEDGTE